MFVAPRSSFPILSSILAGAAFAASLFIAPAAQAITVPYTEEFPGTANWLNNSSFPVTAVASGGPGGASDSFVSASHTFSGTASDSIFVVFRGNNSASASGGAFAGNYISNNVDQLKAWVRQDSGSTMTFGARFASPVGGQAFSIGTSTTVPSNTWTQLTFDINPSNPLASGEALPLNPTNWNTVFSNIINVQVFGYQGALANPTTVNLALDKVALTPEPGALGLLGAAGLALLGRRGRRQTV